MEFYQICSLLCGDYLVSIPNGMEFYPEQIASPAALLCFNSQRDGILLDISLSRVCLRRFQFPTGWNSTELGSIHIHQQPLRFNSQRDGILRIPPGILLLSRVVSIPNGMEFYAAQARQLNYDFRFNSQRDGILLCSCAA